MQRKYIAGLMAVCLAAVPISVSAAVSSAGTYNGTSHIDQFGEYDINAEVTVDDDLKISNIDISGENFGGTYAEFNKTKLNSAKATADNMIGLSASDAAAIDGVDIVAGATYSSNGIKQAVMNALGVSPEEETPTEAPDSLEPGTYTVQISAITDIVAHSLLEDETGTGTITVDESGNATLSYTMISGTEKEPLRVLAFNGYYNNYNTEAPAENVLVTDGVKYDTEESDGYTVVTKIEYPISELTSTYYNNVNVYVPAMSALNGEYNIGGKVIVFDNGRFDVDVIVNVDWGTLVKSGYTTDMQIDATVKEAVNKPSDNTEIPSQGDGNGNNNTGTNTNNGNNTTVVKPGTTTGGNNTTTVKPGTTNTGDNTSAEMWIILLAIVGGAAGASVVVLKRKSK